jgi:hypothetical protein
VTELEMTLLNGIGQMPLYSQDCLDANYSCPVSKKECCRCVLFFERISGTNYLKARCPDGSIITFATQ